MPFQLPFSSFLISADSTAIGPLDDAETILLVANRAHTQFYDFFLVNTGIDKRNSMIRPDPHKPRNRKNSKATTHSEDSTSMEVDLGEGISDKGGSMEELTSLTSKLSGLNFVPRGVRFGQSQRGGFKR